jgi:pimeloyl-ACP methyl ester carboxylesterase
VHPLPSEFADEFRVIAMDQRNAGGKSRAPITAHDGWDSYTADHIARPGSIGRACRSVISERIEVVS